ncbi:MAG: DUF3530 family protein [Proteobacteria bacterium]|nr:MAG: DUF3530 family protein [Pseudomonadota bacterium]
MKRTASRVLLPVLTACALTAAASDLERERRLGEEMSANLFDGDVVEISVGERNFLAAYIARESPKGAVVLLHGRGFHPDWPDVAGPLRVALAEAGWSTLSLQMPVLGRDATYYDYLPTFDAAGQRIDAGIRFVRERIDGPVVLLAHSCGAHMAMHWIGRHGDAAIDAFIGAGMGATDYGQDLVEPFPLERIGVPLLDVLGSNEYERVLALAEQRAKFLEHHGHRDSRQVFVNGADHYFKGRNAELADAVIDWLETFVTR